MANLRFPKVMVLTNVSTKFITDNTKKPHQLTAGQVGLFTVNDFEIIGNGAGATPATTVRAMQFHQNVGDSAHGTVRTKTIYRDDVVRYYSQAASVPVTAVQYIGYDEVDGTKDIAVAPNKIVDVRIHLWNKRLAKWYNQNPGYNKSVMVDTTGLAADAGNTAVVDKDTIANAMIAIINNTGAPANDYKATNELPNYVVATKVSTGTAGTSGYRVGVKIETLAISPDLLNACDPIKYYEVQSTNFSMMLINDEDKTVQVPLTDFRTATTGSGFPAELAALEAESQGYDRVREVFENPRYMKLANYVINAADGVKYDYIYLLYRWTHNMGPTGAAPKTITEPYELILAAPTGTLQPVADVLNSWLSAKFPAVTI